MSYNSFARSLSRLRTIAPHVQPLPGQLGQRSGFLTKFPRTPETPIGTCIVFSEAAFAAYYKYGRISTLAKVPVSPP